MNGRGMGILLLSWAVVLTGCDLNLNDPNLPTSEDVLTGRDGIAQLAVGLQAEYSGQLVDPVFVTGLVTDEIGAGAATFEIYQRLDAKSEPPDPDLSPSEAPWTGQYRVIQITSDLLANAPEAGFGPGTTSGILALAELYRAMAFGNLVQLYEALPVDVGPAVSDPVFASRDEVLDEILSLLESARQRLNATPPSTEFTDQILANGFDLGNTVDAMLARYALIAGDLARADAAAARVNPMVLSEFRFSANDPNSLYGMWYSSGNAYQLRAEDRFRLEAEAGDQRVEYWVEEADIQGAVEPLDDVPRYDEADESYPAYLPDEMTLIRAEVAARGGDLETARGFVNDVRTQCTSPLDEPVACLPPLDPEDVPTQEAMLDQILYERAYELYLQNVRYSDLRRFGVDFPAGYTFIPVPRTECDRNVNAPDDLCGVNQG